MHISLNYNAYSIVKLFLSRLPLWRGFSGLERNLGFDCIFPTPSSVSPYPLLGTRSITDKRTDGSAEGEARRDARGAAEHG